jgi:hypothetical protein
VLISSQDFFLVLVKMQENLFASIMDNDKIVSKYREALPIMNCDSMKDLYVVDSERTHIADESESGFDDNSRNEDQIDHNPAVIVPSSKIIAPKYRISIDSIDNGVENSMLKSKFVTYRIRFTRVSDLQSRACWKRYKELHSWYSEVSVVIHFSLLLFIYLFTKLKIVSSCYNNTALLARTLH